MLVLLRSLVARGRLDVEDVAGGQLQWLASAPKSIGNLTRTALQKLRAGEPPHRSGALAWEDSGRRSAGNGSVMCCAPIGLLHAKPSDGLAEDAAAFSRITHFDPRCVASCIALTTAIALLVRGEAEAAASQAATAAAAVSDEARVAVERGFSRKPFDLRVDGHDQGFVLHTLEIAFSALGSAPSLEEGLVQVVARGGDTDTNGCVAGALLGAKFGERAIPRRWLTKLQAAPELRELATALYEKL
jgi:ADP-ribosyl-[dinitrogen reductase] hydrolase